MEEWQGIVESWLLECSEATGNSKKSPVNSPGQLEAYSKAGEITDPLPPAQSEQLLAVCNMQNEKLLSSLFMLFEQKNRHGEMFERVLQELFILSRSRLSKLRQFALQFAPTLVYHDLHSVAHGDSKSVWSIELVLLALYNCEVLDDSGQHRLPYYRLPTLARPSCFHDPSSLGPPSFSPDSLVRLENLEISFPPLPPITPLLNSTPHQQNTSTATAITDGGSSSASSTVTNGHISTSSHRIANITSSTRPAVLAAVMAAFNAVMSTLHTTTLMYLCKFTSRLVTHGISRAGGHQQRSSYSENSASTAPLPSPRYSVAPDLLLQLLLAVYFAIHSLDSNSEGTSSKSPQGVLHHRRHRRHQYTRSSEDDRVCIAVQAIEDITMRCECDLLPDLLHLCYAITHSLKHHNIINGEGKDHPPSMTAAVPPPVTPLSKTCITNASFRTKKLPEDIPVQPIHDDVRSGGGDGVSKVLVSISEEDGSQTVVGGDTDSIGAVLGGLLRREGKENASTRSSDSASSAPSANDGKNPSSYAKFTPTKFSPGNLAIPGLKRKEKAKNGGEKKENASETRQEVLKQSNTKGDNKKMKNGKQQNGGKEEESKAWRSNKSPKEQEQIQQLMEMNIISKPNIAMEQITSKGKSGISQDGDSSSSLSESCSSSIGGASASLAAAPML